MVLLKVDNMRLMSGVIDYANCKNIPETVSSVELYTKRFILC